MKTIIIILTTILGMQCFAANDQQYVQCEVKPGVYGKNNLSAVKSPMLPVKIRELEASQPVDSTFLLGEIEPSSFAIHDNYEVRVSGFVSKPGNNWAKNEAVLLLTAELLQIVRGKSSKRLLSAAVAGSNSVANEAQLAAVKSGRLKTTHHLYNSDYLLAKEEGLKIPKEMLFEASVECRLVR